MSDPSEQPPPSRSAVHPALNAILICDQAIREEGTGKVSLIGIFENIGARQFPSKHGLLCVYAKLTDAEGQYDVRLELIRLEDLMTIGQGHLTMSVEDRMAPIELVFQLGGLVFGRPGRYEFRLYANDKSVGSKTFNVVEAK